jgi:hypothetical protein
LQFTQEKLAAARELSAWLVDGGATVRAEAREAQPGAGLALYAKENIPAGEAVLSIPTRLGFRRTVETGVMVRHAADSFCVVYVSAQQAQQLVQGKLLNA